jgi:hypothetical protein
MMKTDQDAQTKSLGPRAVDANGRLVPISDEERRARSDRLRETLARLETITDETDTDERWREIMRNIDEGRPERKLFEGQY